MELVNHLTRLERRPRKLLDPLVLLLSPMAPHIAEELWQVLGHADTLAYEPWPTFDEDLVRADEIEVAIQVNNRVRSKLMVPVEIPDEELIRRAESDERIVAFLAGKSIVKSFVVNSRKGKLVNLVVME
jgi:leucyl-tRNA synthetase